MITYTDITPEICKRVEEEAYRTGDDSFVQIARKAGEDIRNGKRETCAVFATVKAVNEGLPGESGGRKSRESF